MCVQICRNIFVLYMKYIYCFFLCLLSIGLLAQGFSADIAIGINTSQIDGDDFGGYNKIGIRGGVSIGYELNDTWALESGLYYAQLGSQRELMIGSSNPVEQAKIAVNYIQVPILLKARLGDWAEWAEPLQVMAGAKIGYLLSSKIQDLDDDPILEYFNDWDVGFTMGLAYQINDRLSGNLAFNQSIGFLFNNNKVSAINSNSLRHRWLTFMIAHTL